MIGETVSHYRILEKLGEGGMGVVYRAEDTRLGRHVALKFLPPSVADDDARARFRREAQAASSLEHPNICSIHEIDETPDGRMFIVMPCYEGESLRQRIARGPMALDEALSVATQVASGLSRAHEKGIVHRDIKPGNILVAPDGLARILDFGLAKLDTQTRLTRTGTSVGTVAYMSPEQTRGGEVDARTDIWALGVVLYEMLTARVPFEGDHEVAVVYSIVNEDPEPVTALRSGVPMALERAIDKCLAKDPARRYQHVDELLVDLREIQNQLTTRRDTPREVAAAPTRRPRRAWIPVAAVVAIVAAFFLLRPVLFDESPVAAPRPIAVIGFENQTGDASYDYLQEVIPNLLITRLEQSRRLSVVTWERLHDLLEQRGDADVKFIGRDVGFDLCSMDGIDTIVLGSFTRAGDVFVTDAKVLDVRTKELIQSASAKGEGVGSILDNQIDDLGREISRGVLSGRPAEAGVRPIADVTTRSMEAYHYYLTGRDQYDDFYYVDARRSLEKAVDLDSTFAVAWLYLGRTYRTLRIYPASNAAYARAMRLASSAPEKDRLYIEALYARTIENDAHKWGERLRELTDKYPKEKLAWFEMGRYEGSRGRTEAARECYQKALEIDPRYGTALNQLGYLYGNRGDYRTAITYLERYAEVSPGDTNPLDSMAEMYFRLGDLDKSIELYGKAIAMRRATGAELRVAYVTALEEDYDGAIEWCDRYLDTTPARTLKGAGWLTKAFLCIYGGRTDAAVRAIQPAKPLFDELDFTFGQSGLLWMEAWAHFRAGENEAARRGYTECKALLQGHGMAGPSLEAVISLSYGLIDVREGRIDAARQELDSLRAVLPAVVRTAPEDSTAIGNYGLLLEGEILLAEGRPRDAIAVSGRMGDVDIPTLGDADVFFYNYPTDRDVLARAYAAQGSTDEAIAEYERLVTFDPEGRNRRLIYPPFHYRLARLYEEAGRTRDAARQYRRFLEVWKHAEPHFTETADARARLEALSPAGTP